MSWRVLAIGTTLLALAAASPAAAYAPPPPNAGFDYQIGGDYPLPAGVSVVSRDWFSGRAASGPAYSVCYINAFQTQANEPGTDRPDERSNWPRRLVLKRLGDDPHWGGEYLIDIGTAAKRRRAARWVAPMIAACATRGFEAVEFDNLDSWTRFNGTPLAAEVPFGKREALSYAACSRNALTASTSPSPRRTPPGSRSPRRAVPGSTSRSPRSAGAGASATATAASTGTSPRDRVPAPRLPADLRLGRRSDLGRPPRPAGQHAGPRRVPLRRLLSGRVVSGGR